MTSKNLTQKIDQLSARLTQLKNQKSQADARERARASAERRKSETRRKILLGAFMIDQLGADSIASLKVQGHRLDEWLTHPRDRALFGLPPSANSPNPAAPATPTAAGGEG